MNLTGREVKVLIGGALFFVVTGLWFGGRYVFNAISENTIEKNQLKNQEHEIEKLGIEYQHLKGLKAGNKIDLDRMNVIIETLLKQHGFAESAKTNPTDNRIEQRYKKRTMRIQIPETNAIEILSFINDIENFREIPMVIDNFSMSPILKKVGMYRVNMTISSFQDESKS
ncbi:MAG: hypothetical protein ABUK01_07975 [Leptospirales bacterium]